MRAAQQHFGTIDVLVNNAGHGYRAAVEEAAEARSRSCLPPTSRPGRADPGRAARDAERRSGTIVNVSSGGARSSRSERAYAATKAALEAMTGLHKEVVPLGITVMEGPHQLRARSPSCARRSRLRRHCGRRRKEDHTGTVCSLATRPGQPEAIITAVRVPARRSCSSSAPTHSHGSAIGEGAQRGCRRLGADQPQHQLPQREQLTQTGWLRQPAAYLSPFTWGRKAVR